MKAAPELEIDFSHSSFTRRKKSVGLIKNSYLAKTFQCKLQRRKIIGTEKEMHVCLVLA